MLNISQRKLEKKERIQKLDSFQILKIAKVLFEIEFAGL